MPKDKKFIIFKDTFISKLSNVFKNLFLKKQENKVPMDISENRNIKKEEFAKNIKVEENQEIKRLLNLQAMLRNGQIEEKDITKEDKIKLRNLYENQIINLKHKIKEHRKTIIEKRKK